jgi:hypothetical protein
MRCLMTRLMLLCAGLSLSSCATVTPVDSFCQVYNKVVQEKGDGAIIAKPGPKRRIAANELTYQDQCK